MAVRPDRAVTRFIRDYWPERPYIGSLVVGFALAGLVIGGVVGWFMGRGQDGIALGFTLGLVLSVAWIYIALATRPRG